MCTFILSQSDKGDMSRLVLQVFNQKKSSMKRFEIHPKVALKETRTQYLLMGVVKIKNTKKPPLVLNMKIIQKKLATLWTWIKEYLLMDA